MKTTNLFKAVAFVAMTIVSVMNTEVKAQENNFITNEEVKNELVVAKTIFKQDGEANNSVLARIAKAMIEVALPQSVLLG